MIGGSILGALMIRIGFRGIVYYNYAKGPPILGSF